MPTPARVVKFPILRPQFDNTHLGEPAVWVSDNIDALARFWAQLLKVDTGGHSDQELERWLHVQHEIEVVCAQKLPHGGSL